MSLKSFSSKGIRHEYMSSDNNANILTMNNSVIE